MPGPYAVSHFSLPKNSDDYKDMSLGQAKMRARQQADASVDLMVAQATRTPGPSDDDEPAALWVVDDSATAGVSRGAAANALQGVPGLDGAFRSDTRDPRSNPLRSRLPRGGEGFDRGRSDASGLGGWLASRGHIRGASVYTDEAS